MSSFSRRNSSASLSMPSKQRWQRLAVLSVRSTPAAPAIDRSGPATARARRPGDLAARPPGRRVGGARPRSRPRRRPWPRCQPRSGCRCDGPVPGHRQLQRVERGARRGRRGHRRPCGPPNLWAAHRDQVDCRRNVRPRSSQQSACTASVWSSASRCSLRTISATSAEGLDHTGLVVGQHDRDDRRHRGSTESVSRSRVAGQLVEVDQAVRADARTTGPPMVFDRVEHGVVLDGRADRGPTRAAR